MVAPSTLQIEDCRLKIDGLAIGGLAIGGLKIAAEDCQLQIGD
jgi:hypothetical protein